MKIIIILILLVSFYILPQSKKEVRAVWIATAFNLDWPLTKGELNQKEEIRNILDSLFLANFNTVFLQVRARGDLLYPSIHEPFAKSLTGKLGQKPTYDPLAYFIKEANKRGIELHAWWNVFKVYGKGKPNISNPKHIVLARPELCKYFQNEWWLDPGNPKTIKYLLNLSIEMVKKYDLDGINLDYARYPDKDFNDDATYKKYGKGGNKNYWRRKNITKFVTTLYDTLTSINPYLKVGSSPLGIYKNKDSQNDFFDSFNKASQDSKLWINLGKQDYVSPQIFWDIDSVPRFYQVLRDWVMHSEDIQIYPGIAVYKLLENSKNWNVNEILSQIDSSRSIGAQGMSFFRLANIINNDKKLFTYLRLNKFKNPVGIPSMSWKPNSDLKPITEIDFKLDEYNRYYLDFKRPKEAKYYNIYYEKKNSVNHKYVRHTYKLRIPIKKRVYIEENKLKKGEYYFGITLLDRNNNETEISNLITNH